MRRLEGKVGFVTGAARGQGRAHAVRLAEEGADVIAIDLAAQIASVPYSLATPSDLDETRRQVEALGRRAVTAVADVRDYAAVERAVGAGVAALGRLDVVVANAGIFSHSTLEELELDAWRDMIDVNLTGVWHTAKATIPHLRAAGGGSMVLISSTAGLQGSPHAGHYVAAKHGVVGLMRSLALELASYSIRVNSVHPTNVNTPMIRNSSLYALFAPDLAEEERTDAIIAERFATLNQLPTPWIEPVDVANLVVWLASDEARWITGATLSLDAGATL
jgi:(+)-trans-carveol dehydrogenase